MNLGNQITFIASDKQRQVIPWIRVQDRNGNVTEITIDLAGRVRKRSRPVRNGMDCIDCHNRPAHTYLPPDLALDQSLAAGRLGISANRSHATLRWLRMIGDTVFAVGAIAFVYFALDLMLRNRRAPVAVRTDGAVETVV